jgi:hypothetical protein
MTPRPVDVSGLGDAPGGRSCAGCTLCCKLPSVDMLDKPAGVWCRHCAPASGCTIYPQRPQVCRDFRCGWLSDADVPAHWFPASSRMILMHQAQPPRLNVHVDPARPEAWRQAPFRDDLLAWAAILVPQGVQLLVQAPPRVWGILPDGPVDLGQSAAGGEVALVSRPDASGQQRWRYRRLPVPPHPGGQT